MTAKAPRRARARPAVVVPLYVAAIAAAELYLTFVDAVVGAIAYAIVLTVMLNHSALGRDRAERFAGAGSAGVDPVAALAVVPVMRLVSLSVPLQDARDTYQYLVVGGPLLAGLAWAKWGVGLGGVSFRLRSAPLQLGVVVLGIPLGVDAYVLLRPETAVGGPEWIELAAGASAVSLLAVVEEVSFRGFVQEAFSSLYGSFAPLLSAGLYVVWSLGTHSGELVALAALLGLIYGWVVQRTGSLLGVTISHCVVNVLAFVVLPR